MCNENVYTEYCPNNVQLMQRRKVVDNMTTETQLPSQIFSVAANIRILDVSSHSVSYYASTWRRHLASDTDLNVITTKYPHCITRGDLFELGREALDDSDIMRRFFLASMIWGYGTVGYGAHRVAAMLSHPGATERIITGANLIRNGNLAGAYIHFRSRGGELTQFGWAFMTKFFYFLGAAANSKPMPIILDSIVTKGMEAIAASGDLSVQQAMKLWWSNNIGQQAAGYVKSVDIVNEWAVTLGVRPDAIEMCLFQQGR